MDLAGFIPISSYTLHMGASKIEELYTGMFRLFEVFPSIWRLHEGLYPYLYLYRNASDTEYVRFFWSFFFRYLNNPRKIIFLLDHDTSTTRKWWVGTRMVNLLKFFHILGVPSEGLYPRTYIQMSIVHEYMNKNEASKQSNKSYSIKKSVELNYVMQLM